MTVATIVVDVVYAVSGRQASRRVTLPDGSTVRDAVRASGLLREFPEIDPTCVGIFGRRVQPASRLRDHDRVEIYRPLRADPKELRRRRASL